MVEEMLPQTEWFPIDALTMAAPPAVGKAVEIIGAEDLAAAFDRRPASEPAIHSFAMFLLEKAKPVQNTKRRCRSQVVHKQLRQ